MQQIHSPCDHGLILSKDDNLMLTVVATLEHHVKVFNKPIKWIPKAGIKLYLMDAVPTAENLAAHWYKRVQNAITTKSIAERWVITPTLQQMRVWETPNCLATFPFAPMHYHGEGAPKQ